LNEIFQPLVAPALRHIEVGAIFQYDNAQPQLAGVVNDYIQQTYIFLARQQSWLKPNLISVGQTWEKTGPKLSTTHNKRWTIQFLNPGMECYSPKCVKQVSPLHAKTMHRMPQKLGWLYLILTFNCFCELWLYGFWGSNPNNCVRFAY